MIALSSVRGQPAGNAKTIAFRSYNVKEPARNERMKVSIGTSPRKR
jgi:hypothetical protein